MEKYQDSKNCVVLRVFLFFDGRSPYGETSSKGRSEAERKRKRDEEREDDVTMSERHQVSDWLVASENYRNPYVHPKGEKISMC